MASLDIHKEDRQICGDLVELIRKIRPKWHQSSGKLLQFVQVILLMVQKSGKLTS